MYTDSTLQPTQTNQQANLLLVTRQPYMQLLQVAEGQKSFGPAPSKENMYAPQHKTKQTQTCSRPEGYGQKRLPSRIPSNTLLSQDTPQQHKVLVKLDLHVIGHVPGWGGCT